MIASSQGLCRSGFKASKASIVSYMGLLSHLLLAGSQYTTIREPEMASGMFLLPYSFWQMAWY
jgi:hypothetical protein